MAYSIQSLAAAWKWCRANPDGIVRTHDVTMSAADWLRWFSECLDRKINARGGLDTSTRLTESQSVELSRVAARYGRGYGTERIVIDWLPTLPGRLGRRVAAVFGPRLRERAEAPAHPVPRSFPRGRWVTSDNGAKYVYP